jgi:nucleoside-diphosphate-sugar epimerase
MSPRALPARFKDVEALEEFMTAPDAELVNDLASVPGDIMLLGVGGKMGPTLARLAKRAAPERRIIGVARFSEPGLRDRLDADGIETIACDLLDRSAVEKLPKPPNIVYMAGRKFGASGDTSLTWAMNVLVPAYVAEAFARARIVAFSSGNIYPFMPVGSQGATEATPTLAPPNDYSYSCLGRERMFQYFSNVHKTPGRLFRLNYANDMRYGVIHDVCTKVRDGAEIDLTVGHANVIWQGDANAFALRCLAHTTTPTSPINVSGPETLSIRWLAEQCGKLLGKKPIFVKQESPEAWLTNTALMCATLGYPGVPLMRMIEWQAEWLAHDLPTLNKPTRYEVRDGRF